MARSSDLIIADHFAQSVIVYARQVAALEAEVERLRAALKEATTPKEPTTLT